MKKIFIRPSAEFVSAEVQSILAASYIQGAGSNKGQGIVPEARRSSASTEGIQGNDISALQLN